MNSITPKEPIKPKRVKRHDLNALVTVDPIITEVGAISAAFRDAVHKAQVKLDKKYHEDIMNKAGVDPATAHKIIKTITDNILIELGEKAGPAQTVANAKG